MLLYYPLSRLNCKQWQMRVCRHHRQLELLLLLVSFDQTVWIWFHHLQVTLNALLVCL